MEFCRDLIQRMFKGPRLLDSPRRTFSRTPLIPPSINVPNYFDVVKRPMDLRTIQGRMNRNEYATAAEVSRLIIRQIFQETATSIGHRDESDLQKLC